VRHGAAFHSASGAPAAFRAAARRIVFGRRIFNLAARGRMTAPDAAPDGAPDAAPNAGPNAAPDAAPHPAPGVPRDVCRFLRMDFA
jgi:hypothetical protein